jgi:hypothetical protein
LGKPLLKLASGFIRANFRPPLEKNRAGIHPLIHEESRDPGFPLAVNDGPIYGRSAPIPGKKGGMNVNASEPGQAQDHRSQKLPKRSGNEKI